MEMRIEDNYVFYRECGKEYILIPSGADSKGRPTYVGIEVWDEIPSYKKGWKPIKGATTAPKGYIWVSNNKSRFDPERKKVLLRESYS